jgi:hypothetical protein
MMFYNHFLMRALIKRAAALELLKEAQLLKIALRRRPFDPPPRWVYEAKKVLQEAEPETKAIKRALYEDIIKLPLKDLRYLLS